MNFLKLLFRHAIQTGEGARRAHITDSGGDIYTQRRAGSSALRRSDGETHREIGLPDAWRPEEDHILSALDIVRLAKVVGIDRPIHS